MDAHIADDVPRPRGWVLGPRVAGLELLDALDKHRFVVVEVGVLVRLRQLFVFITLGPRHADGHPVVRVLGEEIQPFAVPSLIQQPRFVVEKLLDLVLECGVNHARAP